MEAPAHGSAGACACLSGGECPTGRSPQFRGCLKVVVAAVDGTVCRLLDTTAALPRCTLNGLVDGLTEAPPRWMEVAEARLPPM